MRVVLFQSYYVKEVAPAIKVKEDVVTFAKIKWPMLFSKFYEAIRMSGEYLLLLYFSCIYSKCSFSFSSTYD